MSQGMLAVIGAVSFVFQFAFHKFKDQDTQKQDEMGWTCGAYG